MRGRPHQSLLQTACAAAAVPDSRDAATALLCACEQVGADGGIVHLLDLACGSCRPFVSRSERESAVLPAEQATPFARIGRDADGTGTLVYAVRGTTCVGVLQLDGLAADELDPQLRAELVAVADLLVPIYEREFLDNLLGTLPQPIDFTQSERDYFYDVGRLIAEASGMQFAILRERDGHYLRCVAQWGHNADLGTLNLDVRRHADHPAVEALRGERVVIDQRRPTAGSHMRSFVILPVRVGRETFGALSLGTSCSFEYSPLEVHGFEMIANGIGVSIANFRSSREASRRSAEFMEAAAAVAVVEIAQQVRHEVDTHRDNCNASLARLWRRLGASAGAVESEFDAVSTEIAAIGESLDRMRRALAPSMRTWAPVSVRALWSEARSLVVGQLDTRGIETYLRGVPDTEVFAMPDELRSVFLHLLLNSIDAFDRTSCPERHVKLEVRAPRLLGGEISLEYSDNAGGVHPGHLRRPEGTEELTLEQALFERGTTSKREGSGVGLWLVRRILRDHCGSIRLLEHRGRVVFAIRLPQEPEQIAA